MRQNFVWIVLLYLRFWARLALAMHRPRIIGIAGSLGKSSAKRAVYAVLKDNFPTMYLEGNSETGIPLSILGVEPRDFSKADWLRMLIWAPFGIFHLAGVKFLVVEMGTDELKPPKNMGYLLTILKPEFAIFLNASPAHTLQFGEGLSEAERNLPEEKRIEAIQELIANEDGKIITESGCRRAIYSQQDKFVREVVENFVNKVTNFMYIPIEEIKFKNWDSGVGNTSFEFGSNEVGWQKVTLHGMALPEEFKQTIGAAVVLATELDLSQDQIGKALEKNFELPFGRASIFKGVNQSVIVDSSYNASKISMLGFINLLKKLKAKTKRPIAVLIGDMRELGGEAQHEHEEVARELVKVVDYLYCVGPLTKQYVIPVGQNSRKIKEVKWFERSIDAGNYLKVSMPAKAVVLAKGSQNKIFLEEAVKKLLLNPEDEKKLCRQDAGWMKRKKLYFLNNFSAESAKTQV